MPDRRRHRGSHPQDAELFAPERIPGLRRAVTHLAWLLSRGYAEASALKLVGDRFNLAERQRIAVRRCACTDQALTRRRQTKSATIAGEALLIDGYNLLTTLEAALAGGVILLARDGCYRDLASMHGTYRKVQETIPALILAGEWLMQSGLVDCHWLLDSPVSNSGRLAAIMRELAVQRGWSWGVDVVQDPDAALRGSRHLIVTADSAILDRCHRWLNLAREIVASQIPDAWVIDLSDDANRSGREEVHGERESPT